MNARVRSNHAGKGEHRLQIWGELIDTRLELSRSKQGIAPLVLQPPLSRAEEALS